MACEGWKSIWYTMIPLGLYCLEDGRGPEEIKGAVSAKK